MVQNLISRSTIEERKRAIVKTLCYRLFMIVITVVVAWFFTGDVSDALSIGLVSNVVKTGTYYVYERAWDDITWGVSQPP